jgi:hypothetical protein
LHYWFYRIAPEIASEMEKTSTKVASSFATFSLTTYLRPISPNLFFFLNFMIPHYDLLVHNIILTSSSSFLVDSISSADRQMPTLGKSSHLCLTFTNLPLDLFTANALSRLVKYIDDGQGD